MTPLAITLVLLSSLMHALRDFFTKKAQDTRAFQWWFCIGSLVMFIPAFVYLLMEHGLSWFGLFYMAAAGLSIHTAYWTFLGKSYENGDLSQVYPIVRSAPAVVLIFSILFLNDDITAKGITGVILVVLGAYIINMQSLSVRSLLEPLRSMRTNQTMQFAFLTMLAVASYAIIDSIGVQYVHPLTYLYGITLFLTISFTFYVFKTRSREVIMDEWRYSTGGILFCSFFGMVSYGMILYTYTMAPVSYVVGFRQTSIVIAVLLGGHILQEKHKEIRLLAALLISGGAVLIALA